MFVACGVRAEVHIGAGDTRTWIVCAALVPLCAHVAARRRTSRLAWRWMHMGRAPLCEADCR